MSVKWYLALGELCNKCCNIISKILCFFKSQIYDVEYYLLTKEELEEFNKFWIEEYLNKILYISDRFDCDDFAMLYKALAVMMTGKNAIFFMVGKLYDDEGNYLGLHAWVVAITTEGLKFVEPQTGDIFDAGCKVRSSDGFIYEPLWVVG